MMKAAAAALLVPLLLANMAQAAECGLDRAVYENRSSGWQLRFGPVGRDGAANQLAAFTLDAPGVAGSYSGGIYVPNGFGQPMADIGLDCPVYDPEADTDEPADEEESCRFWTGSVYQLMDGTMGMLAYDTEQFSVVTAPDQLLLPDFALGVWYSRFRSEAFTDTTEVGDVFSFKGCAAS